MAKQISELGIRVDANGAITVLDQFGNKVKEVGGKTNSLEGNLKSLKGALASLGAGISAGLIFRKFIDETAEAERVQSQLQATIRSTGGAAGKTVEDLNKTADALQKLSLYSDEAIGGAQGLLLTFTKIRGENFDAATQAVLDLSTAMGGDLKGAALQVGKALNDPAIGLTALTRSGVSFSEAQQKVIKDLIETGHAAEAQKLILKELQAEFGGSAEAARNTFGGSLAYLGNQFDNLFEKSSEDTKNITKAINSLADNLPQVSQAFDTFFGGLKSGFEGLVIGYERDARDIAKTFEFLNRASSFNPTLPKDMRDQLRAWADESKRQADDLQRDIDRRLLDAKGTIGNNRANDPLSERNEIASTLYGGGSGNTNKTIHTTTDAIHEQKQAVDDLRDAYDHNKQSLDEFIAQQITLNDLAQKKDSDAARDFIYGAGAYSGGRTVKQGVDNSVNEAIDITKKWAGELDKSNDKLSGLEKSAQIAGQALEYYLVTKLGGGGAGASVGAAVGKGALEDFAGGFAKTALGSALFGPIAAGVGAALGGVVDKLDLFGNHVGEAAEHLRELEKAATESITNFIQSARGYQTVDEQVAAKWKEVLEALDKLREAVGTGPRFTEGYDKIIAAFTAFEKRIRAQDAESKRYASEDLDVRELRAKGKDKEADAKDLENRQAAEYAKAVADGMSDEYLAHLKLVQGMEKTKAAFDDLTKSTVNLVQGYKYQATIFQNSQSRTFGTGIDDGIYRPPITPISSTSGASYSSAGGDRVVVQLVLPNGQVLGETVLTDWKARSQRKYGTTTRYAEL